MTGSGLVVIVLGLLILVWWIQTPSGPGNWEDILMCLLSILAVRGMRFCHGYACISTGSFSWCLMYFCHLLVMWCQNWYFRRILSGIYKQENIFFYPLSFQFRVIVTCMLSLAIILNFRWSHLVLRSYTAECEKWTGFSLHLNQSVVNSLDIRIVMLSEAKSTIVSPRPYCIHVKPGLAPYRCQNLSIIVPSFELVNNSYACCKFLSVICTQLCQAWIITENGNSLVS